MPTEVEIPDFGVVEFPDGMPEPEMAAAIREGIYRMPALPAFQDFDSHKDRRFIANANLARADEELEAIGTQFQGLADAVKAGQATTTEEDVLAAQKALRFAKSKRDIAFKEFQEVEKDPAPFMGSLAARGQESILNQAAHAMRIAEGFMGDGPKRPEDAPKFDQLMRERGRARTLTGTLPAEGTLGERFSNLDLGRTPEEQSARNVADRVDSLSGEIMELRKGPMEERASTQLRQTAGQIAQDMGVNLRAENTRAQIGRGAGSVLPYLPTMFAGVAGVPLGAMQAGGEAYERAYTQREQEMRAEGVTNPRLIDEAAQEAGSREAVKAAPDLAALLTAGKLTSVAVGKMLPDASPLRRGLWGFGAAAAGNVAAGGALRWLRDENFLPTVEQLTADILFSVKPGFDEAGAARKAAAERPAEGEAAPAPETIPTEAPDAPLREMGESLLPETAPTPEQVAETAPADVDPNRANRLMGPGAANIEEIAGPAKIAAYNDAVDAQRAERGLEPLMSEARKADQTTWDATERRIEQDPDYPTRLAEEINSGEKRAVSDEEQSALLWRMIDLRNKRDNAQTRALDEGTYTPEERQGFETETRFYEEQLQKTEEADRKAGTAQGRALRIRRLMAYEDFTLAGLMGKARRAKGEELSQSESTDIKAKATRFEKAKQKFEERQQRLEEEAPVDDAIRAIEAEASKNPDFTPEVRSLADRIVSRLETAAQSALSRLRGKLAQAGSAPDPTILADVVVYGAAKLAKGLVKFGQWSAAMVRDLGEGVKPYLEDAWKGSNANIDDAVATVGKKRAPKVKDAVTKGGAVNAADAIGESMKQRVAGGEKLTAMRGDVQKLVETLVRGGIKQREPLVDAVHEVLKTVDPAITRRQAMDAISGYGDFKPLNKDVVKAEVRDLKGQLQQVAKMEDILAGEPMKKTGVERRTPSDEERTLIKQVNELARERGVKVTDPEVQLKSILGSIETRLTNRIKDLRAELAKGERAVKTRTPAPSNEKIQALREELAGVEAQHEAVFGKQARTMTDEQKIRAYKTRTQNRIKELEDRMGRGDFEKRPRRALDLSKDPEAVRAQAEMERVKGEFGAQRRAWERSQWSKAKRVWEATKSVADASANLATSFDLSALRQGIIAAVRRPVTAARNIGAMLRSFASETKAREIDAEIRLRPNAKLYKEAGLELTPLDETASFTAQEENLGSRLAEKLPGVRASNRAFKTFLNKMRADTFDALAGMKGGKMTPEEAKAIGHFINVATGRGNFGKFQGAVPFLGRILWAPRLLLARIQFLSGEPLRGGSGWTRKVIAKEYGKYMAGMAALYTLASMAGWEIGDDPRSSDFGKVIIGNTRIDPLGGLSQVMTLAGRLATRETTDTKGKTRDADTGDVLGKFFRSKLSPSTGTLWDAISGKQYMGEPTTIGSIARNIFVPLSLRDVPDDVKEEGIGKALTLWLLNTFGISARSY